MDEQETGAAFLEHYGVKGMKWGVRKGSTANGLGRAYFKKTETRSDKGHEGEKATRAKIARKDHKFLKQTRIAGKAWVNVNNTAAKDFNENVLPALNKKYAGAAAKGDLLKWDSPNHRKYWQELESGWTNSLQKAADSQGVSASGKYKYAVARPVGHPSTIATYDFKLVAVKINGNPDSIDHADDGEDLPPDVTGTLNKDGTVKSIDMVDDVEHSDIDDIVDDFLEHYGVKGMKWGVRKAGSLAVSGARKAAGKDRSKKEVAQRKFRKDIKSRRRQISDKQLKEMIDRLQNERKVKQMINEDLRPGRTTAARILSESGQKAIKTVIAGAGVYAVKALLEKKFDANTAASYLAPKPKKG